MRCIWTIMKWNESRIHTAQRWRTETEMDFRLDQFFWSFNLFGRQMRCDTNHYNFHCTTHWRSLMQLAICLAGYDSTFILNQPCTTTTTTMISNHRQTENARKHNKNGMKSNLNESLRTYDFIRKTHIHTHATHTNDIILHPLMYIINIFIPNTPYVETI